MQNVDTIIHAKWIIPVEPDNTVLKNHCLVVDQSDIIDILPSEDATQRYQGKHEHNLNGHALIPGLINAHTHASMSLLRGYADDLPLMDWLQNHIWPAEGRWVGEEFVYDGSLLAIAESFRSGVTTLNEMYFFPDQAARAAEDAHMRMVAGLIVLDFPTVWAGNADEYLDKAVQVHDQLKHSELVTTAFAPHAPYTVSDDPLSRIRTLSDQLEIPVHMHVHETAFEVEQALEQTGKRPLARLNDLGLVSPMLMAVHMTQLNDEEIQLCAENGVNVIHNPESNMKLASGICPVSKLLDAGVNVALGTDGAASNNDLDLIGEMRSAALLAKVATGDASSLPAHTALRMATLNGAKALGISERTGSLVTGKAADITAIDLSAIETQPVYNPISQIIYAATRQQVSDVWVNGKQVLRNRELTTISEEKIKRLASDWAEKIKQVNEE